ncbi:hypothetical protein [Marispirochaeta sp.]|uniref:hypothetical protein n=1 Tax=Marispirochaeta sp. TaxID=2038653 RepID=UPI0029C7A0F8|nr:hypothetical protein [Marispirochaeta sp.]
MKTLDDYNLETSPYELFEHLYNRVINRSIRSFSRLMEYVDPLPRTESNLRVFKKVFHLIKELNWGVFAPLDEKEFPGLWKELVLPFPGVPGTGDLKRNTSISTVYAAILDIHGYSAFCLKNRRNLSMLMLLDECIQDDIRRIAKSFGTLSWRSEGDAIILISDDPRGISSATVNIADYFSRRRVVKSKKLQESRIVHKIILPDMAVSGGIAGGRAYTPLVITQDGDISGDIINTAARLQGFANTLAPTDTKILATNHVVHQLQKERPGAEADLLDEVSYFNLGRFQFKGMELTVFEILFKKSQKEKLIYQSHLLKLYSAIEKERWRDLIFTSLINVFSRVISSAKQIKIGELSRSDLLRKCTQALELYKSGSDYHRPIAILRELRESLTLLRNADPILMIYTDQILQKYSLIEQEFYKYLEDQLPDMINKVLELSQRDLFLKASKSREIYDQLKQKGLDQIMKENQKYTWYRIIDDERETLSSRIHIGKK